MPTTLLQSGIWSKRSQSERFVADRFAGKVLHIVGDSLQVQNETATGSSSSSRVRTTLTIKVETIDYDTQACMLRLKGRNVEENQFVKVSSGVDLLRK